jgi:tripartite-type tricarboxylate transporter receptor subunit TctC
MTRAGTPAPVINRMVTEFNRSLQDSEVKKGLEAQDFQVLANGSPEIVAKRIAAETKRWARLATQANIRFD